MTPDDWLPVAGNGLLSRRLLLRTGALAGVGAVMTPAVSASPRPEWMQYEGAGMSPSSSPSRFEAHVRRHPVASRPGTLGSGASRTPLQHLDGLITPSHLHFERHHAGIPDIDPDRHSLAIHGLVARPLRFTLDALGRYPTVSSLQFLECSGNSGSLIAPDPVDADCATLHGLVSASEWGGVPLSALLDEVGIDPAARWLIAEGADAAAMVRSVPLEKALDDAIVALYQNGQRLLPANGYPMRLFLPGWEGNASVKWLRSLRLAAQPAMAREETSKYSDLQTDGSARLFTFVMGVKSVITSPSPGLTLPQPGIYPIKGIAWSGHGTIRRVEVSADGGRTWAEAALDEHVLPLCLTRFRLPWRWDGKPARILSRAYDDRGHVQPTRAENMDGRGVGGFYHVNCTQAWRIDARGEARNVYV